MKWIRLVLLLALAAPCTGQQLYTTTFNVTQLAPGATVTSTPFACFSRPGDSQISLEHELTGVTVSSTATIVILQTNALGGTFVTASTTSPGGGPTTRPTLTVSVAHDLTDTVLPSAAYCEVQLTNTGGTTISNPTVRVLVHP